MLINQARQLVRLVFASQRIDELIELALHDFWQSIESQIDAVVGDPALAATIRHDDDPDRDPDRDSDGA